MKTKVREALARAGASNAEWEDVLKILLDAALEARCRTRTVSAGSGISQVNIPGA